MSFNGMMNITGTKSAQIAKKVATGKTARKAITNIAHSPVEHQCISPTSSCWQAIHGIKSPSSNKYSKKTVSLATQESQVSPQTPSKVNRFLNYLKLKFGKPVKYTKTGKYVKLLAENGKITKAQYKSFMKSKFAKVVLIDKDNDSHALKYLWQISERPGKFKPLTSLEGDLTIHHYTGDQSLSTSYIVLNKSLRDGIKLSKSLKLFHKSLGEALKEAPSYKINKQKGRTELLYRYQGVFAGIDTLKAGDIYTNPSYTSTSYINNKKSLLACRKYKLIIEPKSTHSKGKMIESVSAVQKEHEVLFQPNVKFKIQRIKQGEGYKNTKVYMKEL